MTRTYSRADWQRAEALWGDFSPEWDEARRQAAERGILFPPSGTKWDSWEDDSPSQRAILIRAIRETPLMLRSCIRSSSSWYEVVQRLTEERDDLRVLSTRHVEQHERISPTEAAESLGAILDRIAGRAG
jgi:hypothetical protein